MQLCYKLNVGIFYYLIIILFTINNIINLNLVCICLFVYSFFLYKCKQIYCFNYRREYCYYKFNRIPGDVVRAKLIKVMIYIGVEEWLMWFSRLQHRVDREMDLSHKQLHARCFRGMNGQKERWLRGQGWVKRAWGYRGGEIKHFLYLFDET